MSHDHCLCRPAAQAGRFYPKDPETLRSEVAADLERADVFDLPRAPKGLVAPHAGYQYSGSTAAVAYKQLIGHPYRIVVVVAPSHYAPLRNASIFEGGAYSTPLGRIEMHEEVCDLLRQKKHLFGYDLTAHQQEHSLETQLPFLQVVLGEFTLIPILMRGSPGPLWREMAEAIVDALDGVGARLGQNAVVVASSDLYHGPGVESCDQSDARVVEAFEAFDSEAFGRAAQERRIMACGAGPVTIMLRCAELGGGEAARALHRTNSYNECPMSQDYVVGYMAGVVY